MGYEGRMLIHPSQIEPSNRIYSPSAEDVEWAKDVVEVFEEEGIAKGMAAINLRDRWSTPPSMIAPGLSCPQWKRSSLLIKSGKGKG